MKLIVILFFLIFAGCRSVTPSSVGIVDYSVDAFGDETTKEKVLESIR